MTQIKLRRDTSANFTSKNPVLGVGEPAYETDTKKLKIGDGTTAYTQLEYFSAGGGSPEDIPIATTTTAGKVKPDGTTITITDDGTISVIGGGGSTDSYTKSETNALLSKKNDNIFDISKFTVVGNPTITDDGVLTNGDKSNYVQIQNVLNPDKDYVINFSNLSATDAKTGFIVATWFDLTYGSTLYAAEWNSFVARIVTPTSTLMCTIEQITNKIDITKPFDITYYKKDKTYSFKIQQGNKIYQSSSITTDLRANSSKHINLYATGGSIDLKQFSIIVDGEEVFNGLMSSTKPIYDAIKANNTELSEFKTETSNDFSAVNSALNEKANLSDLSLKQNKLTAGDNVTLTNLTDGTVRIDATCAGLEVCDIGMALYIDETKGLRRYLNGQILDRNKKTAAFFTRLKEITTLYPSLLCTEDEWQTAKTMSAFGQVGKFVFNYSGSEIVSVRLPRVVNVQGLFDLQNLGMTVSAGLPNIQGDLSMGANGTVSGAFNRTDRLIGQGSYGTGFSALYQGSFNASLSNPIYGNSTTVQPEAIQYPYFIQIATGSETENNIINEIELNNPYSLFDSKYSDHELNNLSWLKSEGQWNAKAVYPDAYDELLREYNNPDRLATFNRDAFKVVGNPTITDDGVASGFSNSNYILTNFIIGKNPFKIKGSFICSDRTKQSVLVSIGGDWYPTIFVNQGALTSWSKDEDGNSLGIVCSVGISNDTLYNYEYAFTGEKYILSLLDARGNLIQSAEKISSGFIKAIDTKSVVIGRLSDVAGEPFYGSIDLKQFSITVDGVKVFSGAKSKVKLSTETYTDYDFVLNTAEETFRLPLKNHTADDSIEGLTLYYYVGETVQNANLIDAGRIGEILSTKTDMLQASGAGMPSSKYIDLTLGASGSTYTAPANGWFSIYTANIFNFQLFNTSKNYGITSYGKRGLAGSCTLPVNKGDVVKATYDSSDGINFRFIYAEGSK